MTAAGGAGPARGAEARRRLESALGRLNRFWAYVGLLTLIYLFLRFGFPYLSMWITGAGNPQPIPGTLLTIYIALVVLGLAVQIAVSDDSLREFREPLVALLRGADPAMEEAPPGHLRALRMVALAVPPLLVGWAVYQQLAPGAASAAESRQQHPTIPSAYEALENPYRSLPEGEQAAIVEEGIVLYQTNCRPCHGTPVNGEGPLATGFRPRPIAFLSPGTIDTVVESYLVWRIEKGGLGLPRAGTPWNSAMPPWEGELDRDTIWKIIMAEYDIAGKEPRVPETLH